MIWGCWHHWHKVRPVRFSNCSEPIAWLYKCCECRKEATGPCSPWRGSYSATPWNDVIDLVRLR